MKSSYLRRKKSSKEKVIFGMKTLRVSDQGSGQGQYTVTVESHQEVYLVFFGKSLVYSEKY